MPVIYGVNKNKKKRVEFLDTYLQEKNLVVKPIYIEGYYLKDFIESNAKNISTISHIVLDMDAINDNSLSFVRTINMLEKVADIKVVLLVDDILQYKEFIQEIGVNGFFNVIPTFPEDLFMELREEFFSKGLIEKNSFEKMEQLIEKEVDKDKNYIFLKKNTNISFFCIQQQSEFVTFQNALRMTTYLNHLKSECAFNDKSGNTQRIETLREFYPMTYNEEEMMLTYKGIDIYQDKKHIYPRNYIIHNHGHLTKSKLYETNKSDIVILCMQADFQEIYEVVDFVEENYPGEDPIYFLIENMSSNWRNSITEKITSKTEKKIRVYYSEPSSLYFEAVNKSAYKDIIRTSLLEI